ncbi:MAG: hypothetical protein WCF92_00375 [bacterium]
MFPTNGASQDDMPRAGDRMQIINVTPRCVIFWRGSTHVKASQTYAKALEKATSSQIEKLFSIKLTKDEKNSDAGNEHYSVS